MFGHQDDKPSDEDNDKTAETPEVTEAAQDTVQATDQAAGEATDSPAADANPPEFSAATAPSGDDSWHPGAPPEDDKDEKIKDAVSPAGGFPKHPSLQYHGGGDSSLPGGDAVDGELLEVRQKALGDLAPLIDKLDLPPEEKFHTIMMIIQTSDDQKLVNAAYEAAHSIEDEKTRGQALLEVINEINYFTQPEQEDKA